MRFVVMFRDSNGKLRLVRRMDDRRKAAVFFDKDAADRIASRLNQGETVEIEGYSSKCQVIDKPLAISAIKPAVSAPVHPISATKHGT